MIKIHIQCFDDPVATHFSTKDLEIRLPGVYPLRSFAFSLTDYTDAK